MWNRVVACGTALLCLAGCSGGGKTNGQAAEELRSRFAPKAAQLKEVAQKLPPPNSVLKSTLPESVDPPLVFYYNASPGAPPRTLDFTAVESLVDPGAKPACDMWPGKLVTCIQWTAPGSPFATVHASKPDIVTKECLPVADVRYLVVTRVLSCGEAKVTGERTFAAGGIGYEAFLVDLATSTVIGQFPGYGSPPDKVTTYASAGAGTTIDRVQGSTRQAVHDDAVRRLKAIPGSRLQ